MDRQDYESDLSKRQKAHLQSVSNFNTQNWQPCLHDACTDCHGTGIKINGGMCMHGISCSCPKCSPR